MNTEKIKKELVWIRQFIHKKDDENVVIRDANGKDIASWIDRVDAAIATPPAAQRQWVGLTDKQINQYDYEYRDILYDVEKMLRENNT